MPVVCVTITKIKHLKVCGVSMPCLSRLINKTVFSTSLIKVLMNTSLLIK